MDNLYFVICEAAHLLPPDKKKREEVFTPYDGLTRYVRVTVEEIELPDPQVTPILEMEAVLDETFANLDAWETYDPETTYQDTAWLAANMSVREGGGMRLTATDELIDGLYPGALAYSKEFYRYGYFECYCKIPDGYLWPAYFLYDSLRYYEGATKNEIDIWEWLGTGIVYVTTHIGEDSWQQTVSRAISGSYHKWGCYWDNTLIRIYLDDHFFAEITDPAQVPQVPMNVMFQHSIDGWAQAPTNVTFPVYFDVDWVKVYRKVNR